MRRVGEQWFRHDDILHVMASPCSTALMVN